MKVLSCLEKTSQKGSKYYIATAEGLDKQILSFSQLAVGAEISQDNLVLDDEGKTWKFKNGTNGKTYQSNKAGFQRNDNLIVAQVAFKAIVDLATKDKLDMFDAKGKFRKDIITEIGIGMAQSINAIADGSKPAKE